MIGRRRPIVEGQDPYHVLEKPGDYVGPIMGYTGEVPSVWFILPNANPTSEDLKFKGLRHVCSPPHKFRECSDGSLEIRESIGAMPDYHGYLDEGHVWREA